MKVILNNFEPLSVNKCWQGRRFKTKEYNEWRNGLEYLLPKKKIIEGEVEVNIKFWIKSYKRCDVDNFAKPFLDSLVNKQYIEDDRKIIKLTLEKFQSIKPRIELEIKPYEKM